MHGFCANPADTPLLPDFLFFAPLAFDFFTIDEMPIITIPNSRKLPIGTCALNPLCEDIIPIIVTYNPDEKTLVASINALLDQVKTIVIVDNGSVNGVGALLQQLQLQQPDALCFLALHQNLGLGKAFNAGIAIARNMHAAFVLLMDQDSIPEPGMLQELRRAHASLLHQGKQIAAVGASYRNQTSKGLAPFTKLTSFGLAKIHCDGHTDFVHPDFLISSGSLIPIQALDQIGGMDEELFIDHIDTEWCFRAQSKGYEVFGVCRAVMSHALGDRQVRIWWGRWRTIAFHQPFRYYYMFRNSVLLWKRSYMPDTWKRADKLRTLSAFIFFTIFSPNRLSNLQMMLKGLWHGFNHRAGKL